LAHDADWGGLQSDTNPATLPYVALSRDAPIVLLSSVILNTNAVYIDEAPLPISVRTTALPQNADFHAVRAARRKLFAVHSDSPDIVSGVSVHNCSGLSIDEDVCFPPVVSEFGEPGKLSALELKFKTRSLFVAPRYCPLVSRL